MDSQESADRNQEEDRIREAFLRGIREGMPVLDALGRNDGGAGEKAWKRIVETFTDLLIFEEMHGHHPSMGYLFLCAQYEVAGARRGERRSATKEEKLAYFHGVLEPAIQYELLRRLIAVQKEIALRPLLEMQRLDLRRFQKTAGLHETEAQPADETL